MTTLLLWVILWAVNCLVYAIFVWVGAGWAKATKATISRALTAGALISLVGSVGLGLSIWLKSSFQPHQPVVFRFGTIGGFFGEVMIGVLIIQLVLHASF